MSPTRTRRPAALVPGMFPGAHKRNVIVLLVYCLLVAVSVGVAEMTLAVVR